MTESHPVHSGGEEVAIPGVNDLDDAKAGAPVPELDELLKNIPQTSRDLIDSLFRGQFTSVKAVDRKKLF